MFRPSTTFGSPLPHREHRLLSVVQRNLPDGPHPLIQRADEFYADTLQGAGNLLRRNDLLKETNERNLRNPVLHLQAYRNRSVLPADTNLKARQDELAKLTKERDDVRKKVESEEAALAKLNKERDAKIEAEEKANIEIQDKNKIVSEKIKVERETNEAQERKNAAEIRRITAEQLEQKFKKAGDAKAEADARALKIAAEAERDAANKIAVDGNAALQLPPRNLIKNSQEALKRIDEIKAKIRADIEAAQKAERDRLTKAVNDARKRTTERFDTRIEQLQKEIQDLQPLDTARLPDVLTPTDVLRTLSLADRLDRLSAFVRSHISDEIMANAVEFRYPGLALPGRLTAVPNRDHLEIILTTISYSLGVVDPNVPMNARAKELASKNFEKVYANQGELWSAYSAAVEQIRKNAASSRRAAPSNDDLRNRDFLISQLQGTPSVFLGWLSVRPRGVVQSQLDLFGNVLSNRDEEDTLALNRSHELRDKLRRTHDTERMENESRTASENIAMMSDNEKLVIGALAAYLLYSMWTSKSTVLNVASAGLVATYIYLRVGKGDPNPLATMVDTTVAFGTGAIGEVGRLGQVAGALPSLNDTEMQRMISMGDVLRNRLHIPLFPTQVAFMTIAEMEKNLILQAFDVNMNAGANNELTFSFGDSENSPFGVRARKIADKYGFDYADLRCLFSRDPNIAEGVAGLFYMKAGQKPKNFATYQRIERARNQTKHIVSGRVSGGRLSDITDPDLRKKIFLLIKEGRNDFELSNEKNLAEMMGSVMGLRPGEVDHPDHAEIVTPEDRAASRPAERRALNIQSDVLVEANPDHLVDTRKRTIERHVEDFREWIDCSPIMHVIDNSGRTRLREVADTMRNPPSDKTMSEIIEFFGKLKYALVVMALRRDPSALPISEAEVNQIVGREVGGSLVNRALGYLTSVTNFLNTNILTISSGLHDVQGIRSIQAMLKNRFFTEIRAGGPSANFTLLDQELERMRTRLELLDNPEQAALVFVRALPMTARRRFGATDKEVKEFFVRILSNPAFKKFLKESERAYAMEAGVDLVTAMFTTMRRDGNHFVDRNLQTRGVTPNEITGLLLVWRERGVRMFGTAEQPLTGSFAAYMMRDIITSESPGDILRSGNNADNRKRVAAQINSIAMAATMLDMSEDNSALMNRLVKERVRQVGQSIITNIVLEDAANQEMLQIARDTADTMTLLGMTESADGNLRNQLLTLGNLQSIFKKRVEERTKEIQTKIAAEQAGRKKAVEPLEKTHNDVTLPDVQKREKETIDKAVEAATKVMADALALVDNLQARKTKLETENKTHEQEKKKLNAILLTPPPAAPNPAQVALINKQIAALDVLIKTNEAQIKAIDPQLIAAEQAVKVGGYTVAGLAKARVAAEQATRSSPAFIAIRQGAVKAHEAAVQAAADPFDKRITDLQFQLSEVQERVAEELEKEFSSNPAARELLRSFTRGSAEIQAIIKAGEVDLQTDTRLTNLEINLMRLADTKLKLPNGKFLKLGATGAGLLTMEIDGKKYTVGVDLGPILGGTINLSRSNILSATVVNDSTAGGGPLIRFRLRNVLNPAGGIIETYMRLSGDPNSVDALGLNLSTNAAPTFRPATFDVFQAGPIPAGTPTVTYNGRTFSQRPLGLMGINVIPTFTRIP